MNLLNNIKDQSEYLPIFSPLPACIPIVSSAASGVCLSELVVRFSTYIPSLAASHFISTYTRILIDTSKQCNHNWLLHWKITTLDILFLHRVEQLHHVFVSKIQSSIKELSNVWCNKKNESGYALVEFKQWFSHLTFNIVLQMPMRYFNAAIVDDEKAQKYCPNRKWPKTVGN